MGNPDQRFTILEGRRAATRAAMLLAILLLLGACDLDTSAIPPWETSASPAFVCPGDVATLAWDTGSPSCIEGSSPFGGGGCADIAVNIRSLPASALASGFTSGAAAGSISSGPILGFTTFTFDGTLDRARFGPYEHSVDVVLPTRNSTLPVTLNGTCRGWESASLAVGDFRSEGVRVVSIRNVNSFEIDLYVASSVGGAVHFFLRPGESTPEFDSTLGNKITGVTATRRGFSFASVTCDTIASYPAPINLNVDLTCELSSTSAPIVAATPEATAEEQAPPEITFTRDTLCYAGPGDPYPVVGSLLEGSTSLVAGIGADENWLIIENPRLADVLCWVNRSDAEEPEGLDLADIVVFPIPLPPTATPKPEKTVGCLIYDDSTPNNLNDTVCVPRACTPNDQPGGSCTP